MLSYLVKFLFYFHITETLIVMKVMVLNRSMSATGKRNDHNMGFFTLKFWFWYSAASQQLLTYKERPIQKIY